jgi:transcriptional regulator with XRE-family HTH domain
MTRGNDFGPLIRRHREARGITLNDFARTIEISPAYWSRIETGRENPPKDGLILKAAALLNVPADLLFISAGRLPPDLQGDIAEVVRLYRREHGEAAQRPPSLPAVSATQGH